jgi:hypothetical protein
MNKDDLSLATLAVTLVSYPGRSEGNLAREISLIKGSVLYADELTLISPEAEMWAAFSPPRFTFTMESLADAFSRFDPPTIFGIENIESILDLAHSFEVNDNLSAEQKRGNPTRTGAGPAADSPGCHSQNRRNAGTQ